MLIIKSLAKLWRMIVMKRYINIIRLLLLNEIRNREAMIFSLLLPLAILILIGESDKTQVNYVYAGIICIAFGSMALVGVPSQLTNYRENGILKRVKLTELSLGDFLGCVYTAQVVFMIIQAVIITIVAKIVYNLKFDFTHDFLLGMGLQIILGMLALLSIGVVIAALSKNTRAASTIGNTVIVTMLFVGNTLFPSTGWPKAVKNVVKFFPMNTLGDGIRRTLINNSQTMNHFMFQTFSLAACVLIFSVAGLYLLNKSVINH
ncbi:hypothetical protein C6Y13_00900 [Lactiplantibacillus pentosus]|nr:hypothetical protein C6Y09_15330 [Lactiplantibacillus pentosus]PRO92860.1 hypothetical protein C6Y13_00900 [Lactiplantibacillus pentosus]